LAQALGSAAKVQAIEAQCVYTEFPLHEIT